MTFFQSPRRRSSVVIEPLEDRTLLAAPPWGAFPTMIHQNQAAQDYPFLTGAGETVAIIDSGINYNDPLLGGGIGPGHKVIAGYNFINNSTDPMDTTGHGTGVAGMLAGDRFTHNVNNAGTTYTFQGVAPGVNLVVLAENSSAQIKQALDWVIANRAKYNIRFLNVTDPPRTGFDPTVYLSELQTLGQTGVFIAAPAGNLGPTAKPNYPALSPYVIGTGAVDSTGNVSNVSTRGPGVEIFSPGENVTLDYFNAATRQPVIVDNATGTSFAAPVTTGMAVLLRQINPNLTEYQILQLLQSTGTITTDPTNNATYKLINMDAAIAAAYAQAGYQGNNTLATAIPLPQQNDQGALTNLLALIGMDNYWSFTVTAAGQHTVNLGYTGSDSAPTAQLLDANGNLIGNIAGSGLIASLSAGKYFVHVLASAQSAAGTYNISVSPSNASPATHLAFLQQPTSAIAGQRLALPLTICVEDVTGNLVTSDNSIVTLSVNTGPGQLIGTVVAQDIGGIAAFSNLTLSAAGGYTIRTSDAALPFATSTSFTVAATSLPSPWQAISVGSVGLPGAASYANGTFTVIGSGADIIGNSDAFQGVFQSLTGDGQIIARITSTPDTGMYAKAGIMIRASSAANAQHATLVLTPNGIFFESRSTTAGSTAYTNANAVIPYWLKLMRAGNTIVGYISSDGIAWKQVNSATFTMGQSVQIGLVSCSTNNAQLGTSMFDNVAVTSPNPLPAPWQAVSVGAIGVVGFATYNTGTFTVSGAGADIIGTADAFQGVFQTVTGDKTIIARIAAVLTTGSYAKAGIMIRASSAATAQHADMILTPSGAFFESRAATAGVTAYTAAPATAPYWLKLVRIGNTFSGYVSPNGITWTLVSSASIAMGATVQIGLVTCSTNNTKLGTGTFDNVSII